MGNAHPQSGNPHGAGGQSSTGGDINVVKIIAVGVVSLALFAVGIIWSYRIMHARQDEIEVNGVAKVPSQIGEPEIGIVDQVPFSIDHRIEVWRADHARRLSSYGWIDRPKGIAHIPIEKAMEQVVSQPPDIADEGTVPAAAAPLPGASATPGGKRGAKP